MAPDVELPDPAADAQPRPASVTAVRSAQRADGAWSVTVAAQYADGAVRLRTEALTMVEEARRAARRLPQAGRNMARGSRSCAREDPTPWSPFRLRPACGASPGHDFRAGVPAFELAILRWSGRPQV
jgi:hypothetical protein